MNIKLTDLASRYTYETVLAESTVKAYQTRAGLFDRFHSYSSIEELTQQDVLDWRDSLLQREIRPTTVNGHIRHCRVLWQFAYSTKLVADHTVFDIKRLPEVKKKRVISHETINAAFSLVATFEYAWFWSTVILLQSRTGIRNRQLLNIRVGDIDMTNAVLFCRPEGSKTRKSNEIPLTSDVIEGLQQYYLYSRSMLGRSLHRDEYVFEIARYNPTYKKHKNGMSTHQLHSIYKKLSEPLEKTHGERITGHRLRHTLATLIGSQADVNIRVVQEFFGWASIQTAQNYVQVGLKQKRNLLDNLRNIT